MKQGMRNKDLDAEVRKKYENFNNIMENFDKLIGNQLLYKPKEEESTETPLI